MSPAVCGLNATELIENRLTAIGKWYGRWGIYIMHMQCNVNLLTGCFFLRAWAASQNGTTYGYLVGIASNETCDPKDLLQEPAGPTLLT